MNGMQDVLIPTNPVSPAEVSQAIQNQTDTAAHKDGFREIIQNVVANPGNVKQVRQTTGPERKLSPMDLQNLAAMQILLVQQAYPEIQNLEQNAECEKLNALINRLAVPEQAAVGAQIQNIQLQNPSSNQRMPVEMQAATQADENLESTEIVRQGRTEATQNPVDDFPAKRVFTADFQQTVQNGQNPTDTLPDAYRIPQNLTSEETAKASALAENTSAARNLNASCKTRNIAKAPWEFAAQSKEGNTENSHTAVREEPQLNVPAKATQKAIQSIEEAKALSQEKSGRARPDHTEKQLSDKQFESAGTVRNSIFSRPDLTAIKVSETAVKVQDPENVREQVLKELDKAVFSGKTRIELQLCPENLGKLTIRLEQKKDGSLLISLHSDHSNVRAILETSASEMQEFLKNSTHQEVQIQVPEQQNDQQKNFCQDQERQQHQQEQQHRQQQRDQEDFLNQLRMNLIPPIDESA